jgi:serine/threonine protein kinase
MIKLPHYCQFHLNKNEKFVGSMKKYTNLSRARDVFNIYSPSHESSNLLKNDFGLKIVCKFVVDILGSLYTMKIGRVRHNDLKLGNIVYDSQEDRFKVIDFGNSAMMDSDYINSILAYDHAEHNKIVIYYMNPVIQAIGDYNQGNYIKLPITNANNLLYYIDMWSLWYVVGELIYYIYKGQYGEFKKLLYVFGKIFLRKVTDQIELNVIEQIRNKKITDNKKDYRQIIRNLTYKKKLVKGFSIEDAYQNLKRKFQKKITLPDQIENTIENTIQTQRIKQPIKQPINQPIKQPNNQPIKQPIKQPNNQTISQPNNQTTKQSNNDDIIDLTESANEEIETDTEKVVIDLT